MRLMPALLIPALLVACASGAPQYSDLAKRETPAAWTVPSEWTIHIFGRKREDYGVLTLALWPATGSVDTTFNLTLPISHS
jgi:hypothetical protein